MNKKSIGYCVMMLLLLLALQDPAAAATAITYPVTNISYYTATGNGRVSNPAYVTAYGVCWNTGGDLPHLQDDDCTNEAERPVRDSVNFSSEISGLAPGTTYFVRVYAREWWGSVSYGDVAEFTTARSIPTVTTQPVTDIKSKSAMGHGTVENLGISDPTQHGVCWNEEGSPTIDDSKTQEGELHGIGPFTSEIKGLKSNRKYFVRAYATNDEGTAYGNAVSFTTSASPPAVSTQEVDDIGSNIATANGTIVDMGSSDPIQHGFCWNTTGMPDLGDYISDQGEVIETGPFSFVMTELIPDGTYYVRAYANNATGISYGNEVSFRTANDPNGSGSDVNDYGFCFIRELHTANMVLMHAVIIFSAVVLAFLYFKRRKR
jgi:putative hemolysin